MLTRQGITNKINALIEEGTSSSRGYMTSQVPLFMRDLPTPPSNSPHVQPSDEAMENLRKLIDSMPFDKAFKHFYFEFTRLKGGPDREFYFRNWTFMSLQQVMETYNEYLRAGQKDLVDIAYIYGGMGHIMRICYIPSKDSYVFLCAGGSNGWEREANHISTIKFNPNSEGVVHHSYSELMDILYDDDLDYFSLPSTNFN